MKFEISKEFKKSYKQLPEKIKKQTQRKLILFSNRPTPPYHPSLRIKKVQGTNKIMELTVNMGIRITWEYRDNETILLRNIGEHDKALNKP